MICLEPPELTSTIKTFYEVLAAAAETSNHKFAAKQITCVRNICLNAGVRFDKNSALDVFRALDVSDLFEIQNTLQVQFLIVCQTTVKGKIKNHLIFDGRFANSVDASWAASTQEEPSKKGNPHGSNKRQKMFFYFDAEGKILIQTETEKDLPHLSGTRQTSKKFYSTFTLYKDAELTRRVQTREDILEWLKREENREKKVWFDLCVQENPKAHKVIPWVISYNDKPDKYWEAFTTQFYNLGFREKKPIKFVTRKQKKITGKAQKVTETNDLTATDLSTSASKTFLEKSSPVVVHLDSLTLAYHLGLIDKIELQNVSIKLSLTCAALWIHFEVSDVGPDLYARHIAYKDHHVAKNFNLPVIKSKKRKLQSNQAHYSGDSMSLYEREWQNFFSFVWERRKSLIESRASAMRPILEKIKNIPDVCRRGQYAQCKERIMKDNQKMIMLVHTNGDQFFHSIKNHMAHFFHEKEKKYLDHRETEFKPKKNNSKFRGVQLITCGENNIIGLTTPWMSIMNQHAFFDSMNCDFNIHKDYLNLCAAIKDWKTAGEMVEPGPEYYDDGEQLHLWQFDNEEKSWAHYKMLEIYNSFVNLVPEIETVYLPPVIEQNTHWQTSTDIYSAGRIYNPNRLPKMLRTYVDKRGQLLCMATLNLWTTFSRWFMLTFNMDLNFSPTMHISNIVFKAVWLAYSHDSGPMGQAPEKLKNEYESLIRGHCHGGFSYSSESEIKCGDILETDVDLKEKEQVQTIAEYDISSCYGHSASSASMATAFCYGFIREESSAKTGLTLVEKSLKHNSFEFRAVYFKLFSVMDELGYWRNPIRSVYSNFHFFGQLRIGPFPVDLAIVRQNGQVEMYNMDSLFTHGCYSFRCKPEMKNFVGNRLRSDLEDRALSRDCLIKKWIKTANHLFGRTANGVEKFSYTVISSCHNFEYSLPQLKKAFSQNIGLREIHEPYDQLQALRNKHLSKEIFKSPDSLPSDITFLLCCDITTTKVLDERNRGTASKPLFVWTCDNNNQRQNFERNNTAQNFLVTKDTLKFLEDYEITDIHFCLFFRQCKVLPSIFKKLLALRSPHSPCLSMFAKNLINTTCGFFGFNRAKRERTRESVWVTTRLISNLPLPEFNKTAGKRQELSVKKISKPNIQVAISGCVSDVMYYTIKKSFFVNGNKVNTSHKKLLTTPLANFALIIEYGKNLLSSYLGRLENDLTPGTWKLVYSNVDNIVVVLTRPTLSAALKPELQYAEAIKMYDGHCQSFIHCNSPFLPCDKYNPPEESHLCKPGKLSLQWMFSMDDNWSFASPKAQFYAIKCEADGSKPVTCKTPGLNNLSSTTCYDLALCMLQGKQKSSTSLLPMPMSILQDRRADKLNGTERKTITLVFK